MTMMQCPISHSVVGLLQQELQLKHHVQDGYTAEELVLTRILLLFDVHLTQLEIDTAQAVLASALCNV